MTKRISSEKRWTARLPFLLKSMGVGFTLALLTINSLPVFASSGVVRKIVLPYSSSDEAANLKRGWDAEAARLTAEGAFFNSGLERGWNAEAARLTAEGEAYKLMAAAQSDGLKRSWTAEAARLSAEAEMYATLAANNVPSKALFVPGQVDETASLQRSWAAEAARLTAEAQFYLGK